MPASMYRAGLAPRPMARVPCPCLRCVPQVSLARAVLVQVAVFGVDDDEWGQRVAAVMVMKPGAEALTLDALRTWGKGTMAGYRIPSIMKVTAHPACPHSVLTPLTPYNRARLLSRAEQHAFLMRPSLLSQPEAPCSSSAYAFLGHALPTLAGTSRDACERNGEGEQEGSDQEATRRNFVDPRARSPGHICVAHNARAGGQHQTAA